jgi:hypothetical protein
MATEFSVVLRDAPGQLAHLGHVLGDARVNIEAIVVTTHEGAGLVRFVADDIARARRALEAGGFQATTREVLVVRVLDQPGALGETALVMAKAGINIDTVYVTTHGYVVFGVDDLDGAIQVAGGMAVMVDH